MKTVRSEYKTLEMLLQKYKHTPKPKVDAKSTQTEFEETSSKHTDENLETTTSSIESCSIGLEEKNDPSTLLETKNATVETSSTHTEPIPSGSVLKTPAKPYYSNGVLYGPPSPDTTPHKKKSSHSNPKKSNSDQEVPYAHSSPATTTWNSNAIHNGAFCAGPFSQFHPYQFPGSNPYANMMHQPAMYSAYQEPIFPIPPSHLPTQSFSLPVQATQPPLRATQPPLPYSPNNELAYAHTRLMQMLVETSNTSPVDATRLLAKLQAGTQLHPQARRDLGVLMGLLD